MIQAPPPLLSAEESRRSARPLRGWSEDDQALLAGALQALLDQWNGAWGLVPAEGDAVVVHSCPIEDAAWGDVSWSPLDEPGTESGALWSLRGGATGTGLVPLRRHRPALDALHAALFHEPPAAAAGPERLADQLLRAAWTDWNKRLAGLLSPEGGTAPTGVEAAALIRRPWSGALLASLPWCGRGMALLLTAELVSAFLVRQRGRAAAARPAGKAPAPLVPLFQVVKGEGVTLRVELAEMAVDLGTLAGLRQGDVLRTSHRLDAPLLLTGQVQDERLTRCVGHLGRQGEWRAIELLPHVAPAGTGTAS